MIDEPYCSVSQSVNTQTITERSKFIADVFPISDESQVEKHLRIVESKYVGATHHCYAYVAGYESPVIRYSDNGEPSGTAGVKILSAIQAKNLFDVLVIVTRYFGGVKLGAAGLGRAYFESAQEALDRAKIIKKAIKTEMLITYTFEETSAIMNIVNKNDLKIEDLSYGPDEVTMTTLVSLSAVDPLKNSFFNATRGKVKISLGETKTVLA
jgi:uncharacterized YigZ family protein